MFLTLVIMLMGFSCSGPESDQPLLKAKLPLHLEEHLDAARIVGSEVPENILAPVEWRFDEPQPDWKPVKPISAKQQAVKPVRVDDALRLPLTAENRGPYSYLFGFIYVELPDWKLEDWAYVEIRARTRDSLRDLQLLFNYTEEDALMGIPFYALGDEAPLITDGTVQTYRISLGSLKMPGTRKWEGPWTHLGIMFYSQPNEEAATLDILSIRVIPPETEFAGDRAGVRTYSRNNAHRRTFYTHAPGRLDYQVKVPEAGRLDLGLGVLLDNAPVTFTITAERKGGEAETLLEETYADQEHWEQRSVDLSHLAGQTVTLALKADAEHADTVALWAAPTISGTRTTKKPNVIFYIIDGGAADLMSVYGYNRRTTPNLERLAAEGAVFEHAYSNSSWTKISNPSFMTSLQHSVLGGHKSNADPLPDQAVTMAQHLHGAGYQTAVFTATPFAGTMSSLDRGADALRESWTGFSWLDRENHSVSSMFLHRAFWRWRKAYPGEPYWVHFQPTDVHWPWRPAVPFAGLFIRPELRERYYEWERQLLEAGGFWSVAFPDPAVFAKTGISPVAHFNARRRLYDETMAHQDHQLGRLVERLKARGEWEHTLLIAAADHSHWSALLRDPSSPGWGPIMRSSVSRIPLIIVWPGRVESGQRFSQPVSMIDMLPTILDLAGLPMPDVMQGQSLAPLLLGEEGWEPRPVILDEFYVDQQTGELGGFIEVIDDRWGASLIIGHPVQGNGRVVTEGRPVPLLLYDLWNDPECLNSLHEERPDLVEKYTAFLEAQFEAHQALAQLFTPGGTVALTPEQLRTLRSLGYIR
jgi:arylsulfatase A-like enzyme